MCIFFAQLHLCNGYSRINEQNKSIAVVLFHMFRNAAAPDYCLLER